MRAALIQTDPIVGDLDGNADALLHALREAHAAGATLAVTPELSVCGYPPRDLLSRGDFVGRCMEAVGRIARESPVPAVIGSPWRRADGHVANAAAVVWGGEVRAVHAKVHLPNYDVFDEARHFTPGDAHTVVDVPVPGGVERVGILVCEDLWRARDGHRQHEHAQGIPAHARASIGHGADLLSACVADGARTLCALSASPFAVGKDARRDAILSATSKALGVRLISVNAAGAQDDLVFDGGSSEWSPSGECTLRAPRFVPGVTVCGPDTGAPAQGTAACGSDGSWDASRERAHALVHAIRGYFRKTGHTDAIIGLSGGIDSAVVAALAVAALGAQHVRGVCMPSRWSSEGSVTDAVDVAASLGMASPARVPISDAHAGLSSLVGSALGGAPAGVADENMQSRLRGIILMTMANASGALVLSTGNKSEMATGYATLYGDMCGALSPIGDVLKTDVYALARWINANGPEIGLAAGAIPQSSIDKAPSAELRPDQRDQDTLPPYEQLDAIVRGWVEREMPAHEIAAECGLDPSMVVRWCRAIDAAQHKRAQAPIVPKLSPRAFGPGRRQPIAMRWSPA
jgi:NAD+ synthase (glutamine-hydrolysing)